MSHNSKHTVDINNIDINKILMSGETLYDHKKIINNLLDARMLLQMRGYAKCFDEINDISFMTIENKLIEAYNAI